MSFEIVVSIISLIVATVAGFAAIWTAGETRAANKRADEANANADKANKLALEANEISKQALELQKLHAPSPWSELIKIGKGNYRLRNQSGKDIEIVQISSHPAEASDLMRVGELPALVSHGDGYNVMIGGTWDRRVSSIDIEWRFSDSPTGEKQITRRNVN